MWPLILLVCVHLAVASIEDGGYITEDTVVRKYESPLLIKNDIIVTQDVSLTIEPGVEMRFAPGVMLAVNGTLIAKGLPQERILFTRDPTYGSNVPNWPNDIRLVDERSVTFGRLQINYRGRWRGVCANMVNWTQVEANVTCRQLGFDRGTFSFLSWARNDSMFMLYYKPECHGTEQNILDCPGADHIQIGSRICEHQQTIHLLCEGLAPGVASGYWSGLEFYNSSIEYDRDDDDDLILVNKSSSALEYIDVQYAGVDKLLNPTPAIRASPWVPYLNNVRIRYCALDGTNFTDVKSFTKVTASEITHNRGHGLVVETHLGRFTVINSLLAHNMGHGIKSKFLDGKYPVLSEQYTFCRLPNLGGQRFPQVVTGIPISTLPQRTCDMLFRTNLHKILTLSVVEMDVDKEAHGELLVYDSNMNVDQFLLARIPMINATTPQGITSTSRYLYVEFKWDSLPRLCPINRDCIKFTIIVDSGDVVIPEFYMNNTEVKNNTGHGVYLENIRHSATINASELTHNGYGAGLHVYGGAGDVVVNASKVNFNQDNGVNITYDGGYRVFNWSDFSYNYGNGINITFNETKIDNKTRVARLQRTEVSNSAFTYNEGNGIRVGNYCREGLAVVNDSQFISNHGNGIEFESCFQIIPESNRTNFTAGYNEFVDNYGHAIVIKPLINAVGRIGNNTFLNHPRHTLLIDNGEDFLMSRLFSTMPVDYEITTNRFIGNYGFYVANLRLTQESEVQSMEFKYNIFQNNEIRGAETSLNERTRALAVLIISSSNILVSRNHLEDPDSMYELATHLQDISVTLQADRMWWALAETDYENLIPLIFDQFSRYNLAQINYHPVLRSSWLYTTQVTDTQDPIEIEFQRGMTLGGRLAERLSLPPGFYHVDRDIIIQPPGELTLSQGTTLEFENSLGMLVQGKIDASGGDSDNRIVFSLKNGSAFINNTLVRLAGGRNIMEGLLEVRPSEVEEWGTICKKGWTIQDASVVCQMMGLVIHPDDWHMLTDKPGEENQPIWRSNVACTELDIDVMKCNADQRNDHSCTHEMDVSIRCKIPTWSGLHFLGQARSSTLRHVAVMGAGLMDPTAIMYTPAIKLDYNVHTLEYVNVTYSMATGIQIMHNDARAGSRISRSVVSHNLGNGISSRGPYLDVEFCHIQNNSNAGIDLNPHMTTYEARQLRAGIHDPYVISKGLLEIKLPLTDLAFVVTLPETEPEPFTYDVEIEADPNHQVIVDILDYNPATDDEKVIVYDSRRDSITAATFRWEVEEDLVDFPVVSTARVATIRWQVKTQSSGRLTFALRAKQERDPWPFPDFRVKNTTVEGNRQGIVTRHYNQPSNEFLDLFFRYRWQQVELYGVEFLNNELEALHVPSITKYHELYMPSFEELQQPFRVAEITYSIDSCHLVGNGGGINGEHNHVEFSNNVWIWQVTHNHIENNKGGGFTIELPLVNLMYQEIFNHSVDVNDTLFENNNLFEFRIDGFYCNSSIARNRFHQNECKTGCITYSGTEKDLDMSENEITENVGRYMVEFYMKSHTPYTRWVDAHMIENNIKRNRDFGDQPPGPTSSPVSYAVGVKGLQNITVNRNLFDNEMAYELVAGQDSSLLENYLDVTENYWGTNDEDVVKDKIFDFDDWNNYAIAEYYPYLIYDNFASTVSSGTKTRHEIDLNKPLGGRIEKDLRLPSRVEPYIVVSDLTVMPTASMVIEAGVELQFFPNVGILVLGGLTVRGYPNDRVKFGPYDPQASISRNKRQVAKHGANVPADDVRLVGGDLPYEGFVEIYNQTERRYTLICDNEFNDRTAEVACKTMGKEHSNVIVRTSRHYDHFVLGYPLMHEQQIEWFWRNTFICDGSEDNLDQCRFKLNHNLRRCMENREYVFVRCGPKKLAEGFEYWGNVRFSTEVFEQGDIGVGFSIMEYVDIYGGGILHGEKAAAIQAVYRTPTTNHVRITNCAGNGYDFIAPKGQFIVQNNVIENNNGYGVGGLVLNGESRYEVGRSSFDPLVESSIPYSVFGLVRLCTSEKLIYVENRILVYYKYRFDSVDCIKVIRSRERQKTVALRFLQIDLLDDPFYKNAVELYDGEYFTPELKLGEITPNSTLDEKGSKFQTSEYYDTMGIRITASPAFGTYGFIAEVVTIPYSPDYVPDLDPNKKQRIVNTQMTGNEGGGFKFMNVGEVNPSLSIEQNRIQNGGLRMLNFTSPHVVDISIQNSRHATISNNYMGNNGGGVRVKAHTRSIATAIFANITNNMITHNTHGESLHIEGHHYQHFDIRNNFICHNDIDHRNIIAVFGVNANYSSNLIRNNTGQTILNATAPDQVNIAQRYYSNWFHENLAFAANRSTVFLGSAKPIFFDNYFVNWGNTFEMVTFNRTRYPDYPDEDQQYPEVNALNNWWGSPFPSFVAGRIWERRDDDNLLKVNFEPFYESNRSVIQERCFPGWKLHNNKCYMYMGGVLPYHEAERQCKLNLANLAWSRDKNIEHFLGEIVVSAQVNYHNDWLTWVYHDWKQRDKCTALVNFHILEQDCDRLLPFICERDPTVTPTMNWMPIIIACSVVGGVLFIVVILLGFAILKARQRTKQRLDRRNSLRASMRASQRSIATNASNRSLDKLGKGSVVGSLPKRRRPPLGKVQADHILDITGVTMDDTSTDITGKVRLDSHRRPSTPDTLEYDVSKLETSSYFDRDYHGNLYPHRMENEIPHIMTTPYDHVVYNDAFDDMSIARSGYRDPLMSLASSHGYAYPDRGLGLDHSYHDDDLDSYAKPYGPPSISSSRGHEDLDNSYAMQRGPASISSSRKPPYGYDNYSMEPGRSREPLVQDSPPERRPYDQYSVNSSQLGEPEYAAPKPRQKRTPKQDFDIGAPSSPMRRVPPRPALNRSTSSERGLDDRARPKPKETAM